MPNWVECDLYIKGKKADLDRFEEFARTDENVLNTNSFILYPEEFAKLDRTAREWDKRTESLPKEERKYAERPKDGFNSGGYEWCINNWGTKWGICDPVLVTKTSRQLKYKFECAWSPCCPVVLKMSELFPTLSFKLRYFEHGMSFQGTFICENGNMIEDSTADYHGNRGG